jgi:excinuclease ABC subunit A
MEGKPCPTCHGKRLKPEALSVTFAGVDIGAFMQMPLDQLAALLEPIAQGDFRAHAAGRLRTRKRPGATVPNAASGAVHAVSPDVRRTSALSEEKRSPRSAWPEA